MTLRNIHLKGAKTHNLKNIDLTIPGGKITVITGLSGSGKSSLAFDTLYAEGQRRYVESLSSYARQFLQMMEKPDVDSIEGLSPAISIEQKATSHNPRSTVGTVTEIHDYLRLLYARCGQVFCPKHDISLHKQSPQQIRQWLFEHFNHQKVALLAPLIQERKGEFADLWSQLHAKGFQRVVIDGTMHDIDTIPLLDKNKKHTIDLVVDRLKVESQNTQRIGESIELALKEGSERLIIEQLDSHERHLLSANHSCPICSWSLSELEPRLFSFNSPIGACYQCSGLGVESFMDPEKMILDKSLSLNQGALIGWERTHQYHHSLLTDVARHFGFSLDTPFEQLPQDVQTLLILGSPLDDPITFSTSGKFGKVKTGVFPGLIDIYDQRYRQTESPALRESVLPFLNVRTCPSCKGTRLNQQARSVRIGELKITDLNDMPIDQLLGTVKNMQFEGTFKEVGGKIQQEIASRLEFLNDVGLGYLSLSRSAETLSGGEAQRIRLASQIGSGLTGVMYVLDEPSIGLHQRDNDKLLATMRKLRDLGNTVIVVEHDEDAIRQADFVVDIGPGAGVHGGQVVAQGTPAQIAKNKKSITGDYLSGRKSIQTPNPDFTPPKPTKWLELQGCTGNNLKNVDLKIPPGHFVCITGVSGSGKSTLINDTLYQVTSNALMRTHFSPAPHKALKNIELFDKVIDVDQSPIGRTPRSNPATYTGLFTPIRELFAQTPMSKERGYDPGRFSFNVKGGRCEHCQGDGVVKVEMHFLPDMYVPCEHCNATRYNSSTLEVLYKGKNISDVLKMTVEQASVFFSAIPSICKKLQTLLDVGLGYITLGQSATTLSGGEAQRVKLALELSKKDTGRTLYILDEPTTGLHFQDVQMLLNVLHNLVQQGNTVVVIEHNLDVIKTAHWIIDIGPEGGSKGGTICAQGPLKTLMQSKISYTGAFLKKHIPPHPNT